MGKPILFITDLPRRLKPVLDQREEKKLCSKQAYNGLALPRDRSSRQENLLKQDGAIHVIRDAKRERFMIKT